MICPTCQVTADCEVPRLCITGGDRPGLITLEDLLHALPDEAYGALLDALADHPADPMVLTEADTRLALRAVDATWCTARRPQ